MSEYSWYQTDANVTVSFRVDSADRDAVDIAASSTSIKAGLRGEAPIVEGALFRSIAPASSKWGFMSSEGTGVTFVQIMLAKADAGHWDALLADGSGPAPSRYVITTYDYAAEEETEIGFGPGDYIEVLSEDPSGWWQGSYYGFVGTFPSNFTEPLDRKSKQKQKQNTLKTHQKNYPQNIRSKNKIHLIFYFYKNNSHYYFILLLLLLLFSQQTPRFSIPTTTRRTHWGSLRHREG